MKQSTSCCTPIHTSLSTFFCDDEREVSEILLDLPNLINGREFRYRFPDRWGAQRRRSALDSGPSSPPRLSPSSSPSPPLQKTCRGESGTERIPNVKAEASSPATPLSFSPSESDGKSKKHSRKKVSGKRTREEWLEIIDGLIHRRELLRGEVETVKGYYNKLKALNLELKAKKQEISFNIGNPRLEINKSLNLEMELSKSTQVENQDHPQIDYNLHKLPRISNQTVFGSKTSEKFQYPNCQISPLLSSGSGLGEVNHTAPVGFPDLNVVAEEIFVINFPQPLDPSRVLTDNKNKAAEARRRRMIKIKEMKNSFAAIKPHCIANKPFDFSSPY